MIGQTVSHYKILEMLGSGGMGTVYKAEDTRLHRTVALKFLHADLIHEEEAKLRFIQEAQAASALDHHNICNIHEIDEADGNQIFICMAYYDGCSLKAKIETGVLCQEEIINIAIQIAQGLDRADRAGMVHRDVKPANIMFTEDAIVKIVDFGLAKLQGQTSLTRPDTTPGTVAYMSPERLRGEEVDIRADIWSYGVLLYEMFCGELPFKGGADQAIIYSIVKESLDTHLLEQVNTPPLFIKVIRKCLEKNPSDRYQSFAEILKVLTGQPFPKLPIDTIIRFLKQHVVVTFTISLLILGMIILKLLFFSATSTGGSSLVIVSDFENLTRESVFDNSLTQGLQISLRQSDFVKIVPTYKVQLALQRMELPADQKLDKNTTLAVARRENIPIAISASINQLGRLFLLTGNIIEVASGEVVKQQQVSVKQIEDILAGMDKLARMIRKDLGESKNLIDESSRPLAQVTTSSLEALELYTQGVQFIRLGKYEEAAEVQEKAIALDSTFVMAISSASYNLKKIGNHKKAIYYHNKILPLIDRVTEKEKNSILTVYYGASFERDYDKAFYYAKRQVEKYPNDGVGLANLGHLAMLAGEYDIALEYSFKAIAVDTIFTSTCYNNIGYTYALMGEPEEGLKYLEKSRKIRPHYLDIDFYIAQCYWIMGKLDSTESIFQSNITRANNAYRIRIHSYLACLYFYQGRMRQAEIHALLGVDLCKQENLPGDQAYFYLLLSEIYRELSQTQMALHFIEKASEYSELPYLEIGFAAIYQAKGGSFEKARMLINRMHALEEPDPIFKKRRQDMSNYVRALEEIHDGSFQRAELYLKQVKKHGSIDPFYWMTRKEIADLKLRRGDSTAYQIYRDILNHRFEIILCTMGGVRRAGCWSGHLIPELSAELGFHYLESGDTLNAHRYLNEARTIWQQADNNFIKSQKVSQIMSQL
jgi:serine/threonine protein kinase/Flp pilus assembly protein TadD